MADCTKKVIYPGTFDPITNGHLDIIQRASKLFDHIIIAIAESIKKAPLFSLKDRIAMTQLAIDDLNLDTPVDIEGFDNLLVDFARSKNAFVVIRGLRAISDFEYELQMGYTNSSLEPRIETVHLMSNLSHAFISSTVVRTILMHNGDISHLVSPGVNQYIIEHSCI